MSKKLISVICPVHNEELNVEPFFERIHKVFQSLDAQKFDWELLFTNNASTDSTLKHIRALSERESKVRYITFSRNFGYQCSIFAGLENAKGDYFMIIDVDCEDPPEMLLDFLRGHEEGFDIVYGIRAQRDESALMSMARKIFYRLNKFLADYEIMLDMAEFFLINRAVRDAITSNKSNYPFLRAEIGYAGFRRKGLSYRREGRKRGVSHYNLFGNAGFAIAGILSSSTLLLRLSGFFGLPLLMANLIAMGMVWRHRGRLMSTDHQGFLSIVLLDLMFLIYTAIFCALYLARVYKNDLRRPLYFVDETQSSY